MKMEGHYLQALYDFATTEACEINLAVGDIVKVVRQVDDNWLCGVLRNKTGNFPASFVAPVDPSYKLFLAMRTFPAEEQGDLGFSKGDIILGIQPVDANWWQGKAGGKSGIFPVTHVKEVDRVQSAPVTANTSTSNIPTSTCNHQNTSNTVNSQGGGPIAKVRANMDLTAQLDDELSFVTGDIISVVKIIDEDFCLGECGGQRGQFPVAFVDVIEGSLKSGDAPKQEKRKSKFRWWMDEDEDVGEKRDSVFEKSPPVAPAVGPSAVAPAAIAPPTMAPVADPVSSEVIMRGKGVYQNGPSSQVESSPTPTEDPSQTDPALKTHRRVGSYTQENTRSYDSDVTPYGKTLYPFIAENPNELTFFDNEIVNLIRHVDDQWMEGEIDGKRGIFPTAYVEIIVDCPYAEDVSSVPQESNSRNGSVEVLESVSATQVEEESQQPEKQKTNHNVHNTPEQEEKYGLVLCDFAPNTERELALAEGDTVTITGQLDEHWFEAKHDDGRVGLCPVSYIRVIDSEACPPTPSPPQAKSPPPVLRQENDSPKTVTDRTNRLSMSGSPSPSPSSGGVCKPAPKPQIKPKPALRPKPANVAARSKSPLNTPPERPSIPARRAQSLDVAEPYVPNPKPVAPSRRSATSNAPIFQKSTTMDATLDDLIIGEMNALRSTTDSTTQQRSRSSSATSDYSSIEESRQSPAVGTAPKNTSSLENQRSPDEKYMQRGTAVGTSMFFAPATSPQGNAFTDTKPPLERQKSRPTPNRPPPPPMTQPPLQRMPSTGSVKRPPPRPTGGPRPVPQAPSKLPLGNAPPVDYGPKPVPSRPAPPRPNPARPGGPPRTSTDNLMDFSPDSQSDGLSDQDREIVADLDNRIAEIQKDLEKCMQARQELEHMLSVTEGAEHAEAEDNLAFYNANITGLTQEMHQLKASLYEMQPARAEADAAAERRHAESQRRAEEERSRVEEEKKQREELRQKRRDTRERVIAEIVQTERDYLQGLTLTMETFLAPDIEKCYLIDLEMLFGNIDEVIEVSQKVLTSLEGGTSGRDFDKQVVGESFVTLKEDMKKVYAPYCRNHDDVIAMLEKYEETEEVQEYFTRMVAILRQKITVFDLGSMLIKPVQRILKYPLLLNELIKATEDDHVDKQPLLNAINAMTDVAAAINEYKRRKDLVLKYRTDRDQKLTDKIARLSVHSTKKKLSRMTQRMVGIQTVDEAYNREERKVMTLEKAVRSLVRDIALFIEQLQETISLQESVANDIADYYGEKSGQQEVTQFCTVHNVIASNLYHQFKFDIEGEVCEPLNRLLMMMSGPAKVMKKRHDKLLDYDNAQGKVKSTKDAEQLRLAQQELQRVKNNYEALNAQLLDELPRLYDLAIDIVIECIARLAIVQKAYHQKALDQMFNMLSVPLVLGSDDVPLIEAFNVAHVAAVEALSDLSFIPRTFNPRLEDHKTTKAPRRISAAHSVSQEAEQSQSEGQRVYLTQIYPADRLFRVVSDVTVAQPMDLACQGGMVVGVIKEGDPMGNKDRWFVDNGAIKGFMLKRYLAPYQAAVAAAGSSLNPKAEPLQPQRSSSPGTSPQPAPPADLMDLSSPPKEIPPKSQLSVDLDFMLEEDLEEKVDLNDPGVQSIDWGLPTVQPGHSPLHDTTALGATNQQEQAEPSPPPAYTEVQEQPAATSEGTFYRAVYGFEARTTIEVTMAEGELVKVLSERDLDGNSEWWLVEVNGQQGYAPANYLYQSQ